MKQVKLFTSSSTSAIENEVNSFLEDNFELYIIDIKLTSTCENRYPNDCSKIYDTVMIIYEVENV